MPIESLDSRLTAAPDPLADLGLVQEGQAKDNELGQSEFLKLMTTQLKSQDPLEPMDNGAFIGQMAQFSTVSGMEKLIASVDSLASSLTGGRALEASSLIGREVLVPAPPVVDTAAIGSSRGAVDLLGGALDVRLRIEDASGALLTSVDLGDAEAGLLTFDYGALPEARGRVRLTAEGTVDGERIELPVLHERSVESVTLDTGAGAPELALRGGGTTALDAIRRMY